MIIRRVILPITFMLASLVSMASSDVAYYMQRLSARDMDNESKLQCIDSLLSMGVAETDSLLLLKLDLAVATGKYTTAIEAFRELREAESDYPADKECRLRFKYIRALNTAQHFYESIRECLSLIDLPKHDSLIYYNAYANEILDGFTRHMRVGLGVDYIAETTRLLEYAGEKRLGGEVVWRISRSLHSQKMLEAIYSGDFDSALKESTELMRLPATELEQAQLDGNVAYVYMQIGKTEPAEKYYRQLLGSRNVLYPHGVALMNYMHLLNSQGRYAESLEIYESHPVAAQVFENDLYATWVLSNKAVAEFNTGREREAFADMMEVKLLTDSLYLRTNAQNGLLAHQLHEGSMLTGRLRPEISRLRVMVWGLGFAVVAAVIVAGVLCRRLRKRGDELGEVSRRLSHAETELEQCRREVEMKRQADNGKIAANLLQIGAMEEAVESIGRVLSNTRKSADEKLETISSAIAGARKNTSARDLFEQQFEQAHAPFFRKLYSAHPDLSPSEARMCAYLIMNLTSKEIASITGKTVRAVESTRYRLYRKFNLPEGQSVITYLRQING